AIVLHPGRDFNPHQVERARELAPEIRDARRTPELSIRAFFLEDRVAMIERVEHLREAEGVLRQGRELQRLHNLFDDLVESRRFEDEGPQGRVFSRWLAQAD